MTSSTKKVPVCSLEHMEVMEVLFLGDDHAPMSLRHGYKMYCCIAVHLMVTTLKVITVRNVSAGMRCVLFYLYQATILMGWLYRLAGLTLIVCRSFNVCTKSLLSIRVCIVPST